MVSGRLPSSRSSVTVRLVISLVSLFSTAMTVVIGTISASKRPAFCAGGRALLAHQRVLVLLLRG